MQKIIQNQIFDQERALYGSRDVRVIGCKFDGEADGESAFKESAGVVAERSIFNLRYPFWHVTGLLVSECEMSITCRAPLWYTACAEIRSSRMHGPKALRECKGVKITECDINSAEFGWFCKGVSVKDTSAGGEYFMLRSEGLDFTSFKLVGKYSFQYVKSARFENCILDTKDAFWHAKDVTVKNSVINGEYLGWYSENLTLENCVISGTQPFCYCKNLTLINCEMHEADLAFEKSSVSAEITTHVISIKNAASGKITVKSVGEIIKDDPSAICEIVTLS